MSSADRGEHQRLNDEWLEAVARDDVRESERWAELWAECGRQFGPVGSGRTIAHGKRRKAVDELVRLGATAETLAAAAKHYRAKWRTAYTDEAVAKHYEALMHEIESRL